MKPSFLIVDDPTRTEPAPLSQCATEQIKEPTPATHHRDPKHKEQSIRAVMGSRFTNSFRPLAGCQVSISFHNWLSLP